MHDLDDAARDGGVLHPLLREDTAVLTSGGNG